MGNIQLKIDSRECSVDSLLFPSGCESHVRVNTEFLSPSTIEIKARLKSADDIMTLLMLNDAADRMCNVKFKRFICHWMPYARQDRVCNHGEALSAKVMANLINQMGFDEVVVADPHSDVISALINNCVIINQCEIMGRNYNLLQALESNRLSLVSPDAGANKKVMDVAKHFQVKNVIRADKVRNTLSGAIESTAVYADDLTGADCLIVDDICDGGFTFIKLAEALRLKGASSVSLYVTHGLFTKGINVFDELIDKIYTTNSFYSGEYPDKVSVINL